MNDSPPTAQVPREEEPLDDQGAWLEHADELPARPRKRILAPLPVALLLALALACGFIAGVLVQQGQDSSSGGSGFPSLRGASAFRGSSPSAGGAPGIGATVGQVAYVSHRTLYLTTAEGNTVKVTAAAGSKVTKTVETRVGEIHPGETVIVSGTTSANGSISASSIRAGKAGGFGSAALFGAGANGGGGPSARGGSSAGSESGAGGGGSGSSSGGPALFGKE